MIASHLAATLPLLAMSIARAPTPVLERGESVDTFMKRYDAWVDEIPDEQRAWNELKEFEKQWVGKHGSPRLTTIPNDDDELAEILDRQTWAQSVQFVRSNPQLLELAHSIATFTQLGMPAAASWGGEADAFPPAMTILLPHVSPLRAAANIVTIDLWLAVTDGDAPRMLKDMDSIEQLASLANVYGTMIEHIIYSKTTRAITEVLLNRGSELVTYDEATLGQILDRLQSVHENEAQVEDALRWDHVSLISSLDWFFEGAQDGRITTEGALRVLRVTENLIPREEIGLPRGADPQLEHAEALRLMLAPYQAQVEAADAFMARYREIAAHPPHMLPSYRASDVVERLLSRQPNPHALLPAFGQILSSLEPYLGQIILGRADRDAARLVVAAHLHRLRHGDFPISTKDIDPNLLRTPPLDPYTGELLRLRIEEGNVIVYSAGIDREFDSGRGQAPARFVPLDEFERLPRDQIEAWEDDWVFTRQD